MKTVNLEKIVLYHFESEIELEPEETRENKKKSCYENVRTQLIQMLSNLDFSVELLKDDESGYANKGSFVIPMEDGEFIEWIIDEFGGEFGKKIKASDFGNCDREKLKKLIEGLLLMLKHLGVDEDIIQLQRDIMEQKTMIYISYECKEMWQRMYQGFEAVTHFMEIGTSFLAYEEQKNFWSCWKDDFRKFMNEKEHEYMEAERAAKARILDKAPRFSMQDVELSERSRIVIEKLQENNEYVALRQEYENLFLPPKKRTASGTKATKKRKRQIIKRQYEIFDEITKQLPINVDEMSPLERYMCVCDGMFRLFYIQEEKQFALIIPDKYYVNDRILESIRPFDDEEMDE